MKELEKLRDWAAQSRYFIEAQEVFVRLSDFAARSGAMGGRLDLGGFPNVFEDEDFCGIFDKLMRSGVLSHLEELDLSGNCLCGIDEEMFRGLKNLRVLDLSENLGADQDVVLYKTQILRQKRDFEEVMADFWGWANGLALLDEKIRGLEAYHKIEEIVCGEDFCLDLRDCGDFFEDRHFFWALCYVLYDDRVARNLNRVLLPKEAFECREVLREIADRAAVVCDGVELEDLAREMNGAAKNGRQKELVQDILRRLVNFRDGRVAEVNFAGMAEIFTDPDFADLMEDVFCLDFLREGLAVLNLEANNMAFAPKNLAELRKLEILYLNDNYLADFPDIEGLRLSYLDLSRNYIYDILDKIAQFDVDEADIGGNPEIEGVLKVRARNGAVCLIESGVPSPSPSDCSNHSGDTGVDYSMNLA